MPQYWKGVNMTKILSGIGTAVIAVFMTATSFGMASAATVAAQQPQINSGVEHIQHREDRRHNRPELRRDRDRRDRAEHRRDRRGYWNGHRGYREYRKGYRRHSDGYYYAPEVFRMMIR